MPRGAGHHFVAVFHGNKDHAKDQAEIKFDPAVQEELQRVLNEETDEEVKRVLANTVASDVRDPEKKEVSKEHMENYLYQARQRHNDCAQLPFTIAFFVVFVLATLMHEDLSNAAQMERNFRGMLSGSSFEGYGPPVSQLTVSGHKTMEDIDTVSDIWTYLNEAIAPLFIPADPNSFTLRRADHARVLRYSQLVGGLQLQQIRRRKRECTSAYPNLGPKVPDSDFNPVLADSHCYPTDEYDDQCFGLGALSGTQEEGFCPDSQVLGALRRLGEEEVADEAPALTTVLPRMLQGGLSRHSKKVEGRSWDAITGAPGFEGGVYTVLLHPHEGLSTASQKLKKLQDNTWIDDATSWVGVKMLVLNPDLSIYLHVVASVWLTPSGELIPGIRLTSFPAEPYQSMSRIALDIVWLILWFQLFIHTFMGFLKAVIQGKFTPYLKSFWTWVDWTTVFGAFVVIVGWPVLLSSLGQLKEQALRLAEQRPVVESNYQFDNKAHQDRYLRRTLLLHREAAGFAGFLSFYRVYACNYTILIIVRFFKAFLAQPKLAVVTNTIGASLSDIGHFMVVLAICIIVYAAAGMLIFGHRLLEFSEYGFAINTCFLIMMGAFDWDELRDEHPLTAALWFWSYFLFVSLILLNMALAIVMDVYSEVRVSADSSESVWEQPVRVLVSSWERRDYLSYSSVLTTLRKRCKDIDLITVPLLCQACTDMPLEQAVELIDGAEQMEIEENERHLGLSDALRIVSWTKTAVQNLAHKIEVVVDLQGNKKRDMLVAAMAARASGQDMRRRSVEVKFGPEIEDRLSLLEGRFKILEETAGEAVHTAVAESRKMRGKLALFETAIYGRAQPQGSPGRSPEASPPRSPRALRSPPPEGQQPPRAPSLRQRPLGDPNVADVRWESADSRSNAAFDA